MHLAEAVNPHGRVYATDLSEKDLVITKKRLRKKGHTHVVVIHDEHQINRVHPSIPHVDAIVSIGMMGYLQDVKKVLKEMRELLPYGGKIVFVDYVDFFKNHRSETGCMKLCFIIILNRPMVFEHSRNSSNRFGLDC